MSNTLRIQEISEKLIVNQFWRKNVKFTLSFEKWQDS